MADCINLELPGNDKGGVQLTNRQYLHVTTTTTTTTASVASTTKVESIELKILGNSEGKIELNQDVLCAYRLSNGCTSDFFGTAHRIELILPRHNEGMFNWSKSNMSLADPGGGGPPHHIFFWNPLSRFFYSFFRINVLFWSIIGTFVTLGPTMILLFGALVTLAPPQNFGLNLPPQHVNTVTAT